MMQYELKSFAFLINAQEDNLQFIAWINLILCIYNKLYGGRSLGGILEFWDKISNSLNPFYYTLSSVTARSRAQVDLLL